MINNMDSNTIRVVGVPEHFNLPWHLGIEEGAFERKGVQLQWKDCFGGTGEMLAALRDQSTDLAVLLTEGIVADLIAGNPSKLISTYVTTPLTWGVHTGAKNPLESYPNIYDKRYAISRKGSGSHLIPIVDANYQNKKLNDDQFVIVGNLEGALKSLEKNETDVFYWEKYTTKPYVESGSLRRIGEFKSPWPCFLIAATEKILVNRPKLVQDVLEVLHELLHFFMISEHSIQTVSKRYDLSYEEASEWFHQTEWATHGWISNKMLSSVMFSLENAGIIDHTVDVKTLVWQR